MNDALSHYYDRLSQSHFWLTSKYFVIERFFSQEINSRLKMERLLEVGCNTGGFLCHMRSVSSALFGLDLGSQVLAICKVRWPFIRLTAGNGLHLPYKPKTFDAVVIVDVLEHIQDDAAAIHELCLVLKDRGLCLICVPAYQWLYGPHDKLFGHLRRYSRRQLAALLTENGFEVVRSTYFQPLFLIPLWLKRRLSNGESDFIVPPKVVNFIFDRILRLDAYFLRVLDLPIGCTLLCLAQKRENAAIGER